MLATNSILQNRYRIVRRLGEGGMGTVYEAIDERLGNTVAVKETHFTDAGLRKQFKREAQLLATLRHAALPRVIDHFDEADGLYLVMDFIGGDDLWTVLQERTGPFTIDEVRRWGDQILDALSYLHAQKPPVVHRDIKLQNLKLTDDGRIILLDFGLAKGLGEASGALTTRTVLGFSLPYAPLEQILQIDVGWQEHLSVTHPMEVERLRKSGTDHRSDLYSAGATMLHLLTNNVPPHAPMRAISVWSGRPDPLENSLRGGAPETCWKTLTVAMALEPEHRFSSAASMRESLLREDPAADMRTADTPRNLSTTLVDEIPATQARNTSTETPADVQTSSQLSENPMVATLPVPSPASERLTEREGPMTLRRLQRTTLLSRKLIWAAGGLFIIIFLVLVTYGTISIFRRVRTTPGSSTSESNKTDHDANGPIIIHPAPANWALKETLPPSFGLDFVRFSPDNKYLAIGRTHNILLWNSQTKKDQLTLDYVDSDSIDFSADGKWAATSGSDYSVRVWDVETGVLKQQLKQAYFLPVLAAISPDGGTVVYGDDGPKRLEFWNLKTGERRRSSEKFDWNLTSLVFSPDGKFVASGTSDLSVKLWNAESHELIRTLKGHTDEISALAFSPDGRTLVSGAWDKTIKLWEVVSGNLLQTFDNGDRVTSLSFHPDGKIIAAGGIDKELISIWDIQSRTLRQAIQAHTTIKSVSFSPDGSLLAGAGHDKQVRVWQGVK